MLKAALEWPIKTYGRVYNPWPCAMLDFKPRVDSAWPKAILEAALPLQRFLDRIYEHIISRVRKAGRDILIYDPAIGEELVAAIQGKGDLPMVPMTEPGKIKDTIEAMIHILNFPEMNKDIFEVIKLAWEAFREITGITPELLGGMPRTQDRSAKASTMREGGLSRRPDDYAEAVEAWESEKCALEAIGWRMLADQEFIASIFGESLDEVPGGSGPETNWSAAPLTQAWVEQVHTDDEFAACASVNYDCEAGSGRRKNLQQLQANMQQVMQTLGNTTMALAMETGNVKPLSILYRKLFESMQLDMEPYLSAARRHDPAGRRAAAANGRARTTAARSAAARATTGSATTGSATAWPASGTAGASRRRRPSGFGGRPASDGKAYRPLPDFGRRAAQRADASTGDHVVMIESVKPHRNDHHCPYCDQEVHGWDGLRHHVAIKHPVGRAAAWKT